MYCIPKSRFPCPFSHYVGVHQLLLLSVGKRAKRPFNLNFYSFSVPSCCSSLRASTTSPCWLMATSLSTLWPERGLGSKRTNIVCRLDVLAAPVVTCYMQWTYTTAVDIRHHFTFPYINSFTLCPGKWRGDDAWKRTTTKE